MFKKSFIVCGFPRTGSTFVKNNLSLYFNVFVDQTHRVEYVPPHSEFTAVVTKRKNVFDTLCSHFVMIHTGEMSIYSNKEFSKFKVNLQQFTNFWRAHYDFYQKLNLSYYKQVIELWYEDVMSDPYHLFSQFNIAEKTYYDESLKCPYRFDNLITNVDELRSQYFLLEKQRDKDNELY